MLTDFEKQTLLSSNLLFDIPDHSRYKIDLLGNVYNEKDQIIKGDMIFRDSANERKSFSRKCLLISALTDNNFSKHTEVALIDDNTLSIFNLKVNNKPIVIKSKILEIFHSYINDKNDKGKEEANEYNETEVEIKTEKEMNGMIEVIDNPKPVKKIKKKVSGCKPVVKVDKSKKHILAIFNSRKEAAASIPGGRAPSWVCGAIKSGQETHKYFWYDLEHVPKKLLEEYYENISNGLDLSQFDSNLNKAEEELRNEIISTLVEEEEQADAKRDVLNNTIKYFEQFGLKIEDLQKSVIEGVDSEGRVYRKITKLLPKHRIMRDEDTLFFEECGISEKSETRKKIKKHKLLKSGFKTYCIHINRKDSTVKKMSVSLHMLRCIAWIQHSGDERYQYPIHINREKDESGALNNSLSNLKWWYYPSILQDEENWVPYLKSTKILIHKTSIKVLSYKQGVFQELKYRIEGGYLVTMIDNKNKKSHQICLAIKDPEAYEKGLLPDHIDRNRLNNHPDNIRGSTSQENARNRTPSNTNGNRKPVEELDKYGNVIKTYTHAASVIQELKKYLKISFDQRGLRKRMEKGKRAEIEGRIFRFKDMKYYPLPDEEFFYMEKLIPKYKGYIIYKKGGIVNAKTGVPLSISGETYPKVNIAGRLRAVHILMAKYFVKGRSKKRCFVNHKDENIKNWSVDNLEWVSPSENVEYSCAKAVYKLDIETGKILGKYKSLKRAAASVGKSVKAGDNISRVCRGLQQTGYGFKWKWVDEENKQNNEGNNNNA